MPKTNGKNAKGNTLEFFRETNRRYTPSEIKNVAIFASNPARESIMCHGEIAKNKALVSASL